MKSQIWSPEQIDALGGFQEFHTGSSEGGGSMVPFCPKESVESSKHSGEFPDYAQLLIQDPDVRRKLENWVEEKVTTEITDLLKEFQEIDGLNGVGNRIQIDNHLKPKERIQKYKESLLDNLQNQLSRIKNQEKTWNQMIQEFGANREALMRNHEKSWCEAMAHLLRQFQVANSSGIIVALEEWLNISVPDFLEKSSVIVHLSRSDFETVRGSQQELKGPHWSLQADSDLLPGQVRIESGNAGVIFDSIRGFEKLNRFLESES